MKIGDKVIVKNNLREELRKLTFDETTCEAMEARFVGTTVKYLIYGKMKMDKNMQQSIYVVKFLFSVLR